MTGEKLGDYRLIEKLGEGGMGEVYRALDEMLDRDVALKMLKPELARRQSTVDRFRAEAITLAKLDHPGIARIHGCSRHDDRWFFVMEYVRGETLLARLARAGRLPWTEAVPIVCAVLDALEYAHRRGVVHRDMKPANILLGAEGVIKISDFGIARVLGTQRATRTGHVIGTLEYMSPEQVRGEEVDGRADLYAVGIVLFELLTGRVPFRGGAEYEVMMQHLQAPVPSVLSLAPDVPAWFDDILQRALAKAIDDRFPSAAAFQLAVEGRAADEPAMRVKATRLANAAMDAAVVGATGPLPRATDPQAIAPTFPGPMTAPTVLDAPSRPVRAATPAAPPEPPTTRLAHSPLAAPVGAPPPLPPMPVAPPPASVEAEARTTRRSIAALADAAGPAAIAPGPSRPFPWRVATAAGVVLLILLVSALALGRYLLRDRSPATSEAGSMATTTPPAPGPAVKLEAPAPAPAPAVDPDPTVTFESSPGPRPAGTPARPAPIAPTTSAADPRPTEADPNIATPAPTPAPVATPAAPAPAAPTPALATIVFEEVAFVTSVGDEMEEHEVALRFEGDRIVLFDEDSESALRAIPYRALHDATYARSKTPVTRAERDHATLVKGVSKGGGLFRRTPHWLTLEGPGAPIALKVDGDDIERVVSTIESRTSVKVVRVSEK